MLAAMDYLHLWKLHLILLKNESERTKMSPDLIKYIVYRQQQEHCIDTT